MRRANTPKISCLLVTANGRLDYLKRSIRCYFDQTYPNKELVIVNEGPKDYQEKIRAVIGDRDNVKYVFLDGYYTLGALRNISIALSQGEVFVQWDDDDFNSPERLSVQLNYLVKHPKAKACYFSDQLHYYFPTRCLFWENWGKFCSGGFKQFSLIPGTIMAWKSDFCTRYPSAGDCSSAGEDSVLAHRLCNNDEDVVLLSGFGHMQVYSYHGNNVWDIEHHMNISRERAMENTYVLKYRDRICQTIDYLRLDGLITVMGRDGIAFQHEAKI